MIVMKKTYTGTELLGATKAGIIADESQFICKQFKGFTFCYRKGYLDDEYDDFRNYCIFEEGYSIDGCLADVVSGKDLNNLTFKLVKHPTINLFLTLYISLWIVWIILMFGLFISGQYDRLIDNLIIVVGSFIGGIAYGFIKSKKT